eukprot:Gb_33725 [translate_table: standard]
MEAVTERSKGGSLFLENISNKGLSPTLTRINMLDESRNCSASQATSCGHSRSKSASDNNGDSTNWEISVSKAGKPGREELGRPLHPDANARGRHTSSSDRRAALEQDVRSCHNVLVLLVTVFHLGLFARVPPIREWGYPTVISVCVSSSPCLIHMPLNDYVIDLGGEDDPIPSVVTSKVELFVHRDVVWVKEESVAKRKLLIKKVAFFVDEREGELLGAKSAVEGGKRYPSKWEVELVHTRRYIHFILKAVRKVQVAKVDHTPRDVALTHRLNSYKCVYNMKDLCDIHLKEPWVELQVPFHQDTTILLPSFRGYNGFVTRDLITEIAMLEEEVNDREQHVLSLYRSVFDQCRAGSPSKQYLNKVSPSHVKYEGKRLSATISRAICTSNKFPPPQHRRHVSVSTQDSQNANMQLQSKSRHASLSSSTFSMDERIQSLHSQTASRLQYTRLPSSERIVKDIVPDSESFEWLVVHGNHQDISRYPYQSFYNKMELSAHLYTDACLSG